MSFGVSNLVGLNLKDRIPESSKLVGNAVDVQSVVVQRKTVKVPANNGSSFSQNQTINVKLQSSSDFLIPSTGAINFYLTNDTVVTAGGAQSTTASFDDLASCVINRATLNVGGSQLENIQDVNKAINVLVYSHMNQAHYEHEAGLNLKSWKWNKGYNSGALPNYTPANLGSAYVAAAANANLDAVVTSVTTVLDSLRPDEKGVAARQVNRATLVEHVAGVKQPIFVSIPLSYIYGMFRSNVLFPLAFVSDLQLELITESAIKAIISTGVDTAGYTITNPYVTMDVVTMSSDYMRVLQASFNSGDEALSYTLPVDTLSTSNQNNTGAGEKDLVFSKSTPFLKNIYFRFSQIGDDSDVNKYSISGQSYQLNASPLLRLSMDTKVFPEYDFLRTPEEVYRHAQMALSQHSNVADNVGLATAQTWNTSLSTNSHFYALFGFQKISGLGSDYYSMDSFDASLAGGVINLHGNFLATTNVLAIFEHTRVLKLGNGRTDIKG